MRCWLCLLTLLFSPFASLLPEEGPKDGFTINYNTVPIVEYIRFASKICNVNFIFNAEELDFTVTVVSEGPITPENVMSTLVQILRIHGLQLLEQDNNLVIHTSGDVRQVATIVTDGQKEGKSPIVTRIFRMKNAKPDSIAAIVRPMISQSAILEVSPETRQVILTDVRTNVDKIANLIENLDSPHTPLQILSFEAKNNQPTYLVEIAMQLMQPMAQGNPFLLVPAALSNTIFIVSTPELADQASKVLSNLDVPPKTPLAGPGRKLGTGDIFIYKLANRSGDEVLKGLSSIADNLEKTGHPQPDLIDAIDNAKWIRETNSILIVGSQETVNQVKGFIAGLDSTGGTGGEKGNFFVYKPVSRSAKEIDVAVKEMAVNLQKTKGADHALIETLESAKVNSATQTITFSGEERTFARVKEFLATIDSGKERGKNGFYIYQIQVVPYSQLETSLKNLASDLEKTNGKDDGLVETISGMKYVSDTNSIIFIGPDAALKRLQDILPSLDGGGSAKAMAGSQFFIYKPKYQKGDRLESLIKDVADNLKANHLGDPQLLRTIDSMKWVKSTNSFLFTGDPSSLKKVEDLLATLDVPATTKSGYFIYKLQHASGEVIEEDLDSLAKNFKNSGLKDSRLLEVIENMRYVKETNSLLLTGDPQAIEEVKDLIAKYDNPGNARGPVNSTFFMYKPKYTSASNIEKSLQDIAQNLRKSKLSDPSLLAAIDSAKYIESTNSLVFTGNPDALAKLKIMIAEVDVASSKPIHQIGKTSFLLYKLKHASGSQIMTSLRGLSIDLKKSGTSDKEFLATLNSMKYVKETNSLLFTGSEESLAKVQTLVDKFDVEGLALPVEVPPVAITAGGANNFFVYKPQSVSGQELERLMADFAENLKSSGLSDPDFFQSVASMRWVESTQSLIFTGNQKSLDQIKELLKGFDIPANLPSTGGIAGGPQEPSIQAIDNTSFLVYKLQFHKGDEIQGAMRQIAKDLMLSNASVNQNLLNSINSIQWLEVTNSLLCSGDQETLTRLRELVKNLDIPLKQVFIEMLVLQTSLTNALTFGLEWGSKFQYKNVFSGTMNNLIPSSAASGAASGGTSSDPLNAGLANVNGTTPPTTSDVNILGPGFDLGIIGEVIRYGGDTYVTLGSLLAALQQDAEATIMMTPKILTQDGRTSSIFSGANIPFAGSFVSNSSVNANGGTIGTTNIEYRDIGTNLTITPVLGNSDIVTLEIALDQTSTETTASQNQITFSATGVPTAINGITTSKTTMQTTVHVPDNHFLILSGMVNNSNVRVKTGIPCLGGLPLIGAAFSQDNTTISNTNIVIFLRPHIVNSLDDVRNITHAQEEFFREQTGTPYLEHAYDEAMELIKTVDDE
ncbi:MAG: hypothetical protein KGJ02_01195 [Verrucomicrobiota bacterium]|nr:hypothetical protein [Verrucomicrobiota bacterium]